MLPWSQSQDQKFNIITRQGFYKCAISKDARDLLNKELKGVNTFRQLQRYKAFKINVPENLEIGKFFILKYPLIHGHRSSSPLNILHEDHDGQKQLFRETVYFHRTHDILKFS